MVPYRTTDHFFLGPLTVGSITFVSTCTDRYHAYGAPRPHVMTKYGVGVAVPGCSLRKREGKKGEYRKIKGKENGRRKKREKRNEKPGELRSAFNKTISCRKSR